MKSPDFSRAGAGLWVGLALLILSSLMVFSTATMRLPPNYSKVGPQVFPYAAALVLAILGLNFLWRALAHHPDRLMPDTDKTDIVAVASVTAGFLVFILALQPLGFVLSAACLFVAVARGFGSQRWLRDFGIGLALSVAAFLVFTRLLDLQLPAGILEGLF